MQQYQVAVTRERGPELVCWEGQALNGEDALRSALAAGARLGGWAIIARAVQPREHRGRGHDL